MEDPRMRERVDHIKSYEAMATKNKGMVDWVDPT
jgi:hypothetical protein